MRSRYYVKAHHNLVTPLYSIWDRETNAPAKHLWFWVKREDAQAVIDEYEQRLPGAEPGP